MGKGLFFAFFITASTAAYATQCPLGEAIIGKGVGKSLSEAKSNADISIAENINSSLRISSTDFFSQVEVNGVPTDSSNFLQIAAGKSFLENREAVRELKAPYKDEHGNIVAERYICKSDAAKPYIRYLGYIASELKALTQKVSGDVCKNINDIYYNRVKGLEGILENLGRLDKSMQKEYDDSYKKITEECDRIGKIISIHLSVSGSEYIAGELGAALQKEGCDCSIAKTAGEATYAITVKAKQNRCGKPEYGIVYCFVNATVSVKNLKTDKNIPIQIPEASAGWPSNEPKRAVEEAFKELTESIAKELLKEIKK